MIRRPEALLPAMLTALAVSAVAAGQSKASDTYHNGPNAGFGEYVTVNEQQRVLLNCRRELGLHGPATFKAVYPSNPPGGQTLLRIAPDRRLSEANATQINACADRILGRAVAQPEDVAREFTPGCFDGAPVLVGGATYCIRGN
jgi:hypothetical protein